MSDAAKAILDAAEIRIRKAGFNGFSFRDIAADVGIKSSSVHYHFPTKEKLAAAVIRRYTEDVSDHMDEMFAADKDIIRIWTTAFRSTLQSADRMCPCSVMGVTVLELPKEVAAAVRDFFKMCHAKMIEQGLDPGSADLFFATMVGGQVISTAMSDPANFDRVVAEMMRTRERATALVQPVAS